LAFLVVTLNSLRKEGVQLEAQRAAQSAAATDLDNSRKKLEFENVLWRLERQ
jgi:hypothetical protein